MKLSFYFDIYPWTKPTDTIYASTFMDSKKHSGSTRYRIDIEVADPVQPDKIISAKANEIIIPQPT